MEYVCGELSIVSLLKMAHDTVRCRVSREVPDGSLFYLLTIYPWPSDYYPLLVVQAGSDEVRDKGVRETKRVFRALGRQVKRSGAKVVFSSIPPNAGEDEGRNKKSEQINIWLQAWCHMQNLGFFDHGSVYMAPGLLTTDGVHLSQKGKRILAQKIAGLIDTAFN